MAVLDPVRWHRLFHAYSASTDDPIFLDALARDEIIDVDRNPGWQFGGVPHSFVWSGLYVNTAQSVTVRLLGDCSGEGDYTGNYKTIGKGSTVSPYDNSACTFSVHAASQQFK